MSVKVSTYQGGGGLSGLMNSTAGKIGIGFLTGGVGGAALSVAAKPGSPAAGAASAYGTAKAIGGSPTPPKDASPGVDPLREMNISNPDDYNPMQSKADQLGSSDDHKETIRRGLAALGHADIPQELRNEYAEPLLTAYHFGGARNRS